MQVQKMKIKDLKPAAYNPPSRTRKETLGRLLESIEEVGLIQPLTVTKGGGVIEGHRRLACAKILGWEDIPVIIAEGHPDEIYASVNGSIRRINGNEQLAIWLKNPKGIHNRLAAVHKKAEEDLGREMLEKIAKAGSSITIWRWAKQISGYLGDKRPAFVKKAAGWLIKHRCAKIATCLIGLKQPADTIAKAIRLDKPIVASYELQK